MTSKYLAIVANGPTITDVPEGYEVWALGTGTVEGADRYYELHGLPSKEPRYDFHNIPMFEFLHEEYPLSNTVCIMLAHAIWEKRFVHIDIIGSAMRDKAHQKFHSALAEMVGRAKGAGITVRWRLSGMEYKRFYMEEDYYAIKGVARHSLWTDTGEHS